MKNLASLAVIMRFNGDSSYLLLFWATLYIGLAIKRNYWQIHWKPERIGWNRRKALN